MENNSIINTRRGYAAYKNDASKTANAAGTPKATTANTTASATMAARTQDTIEISEAARKALEEVSSRINRTGSTDTRAESVIGVSDSVHIAEQKNAAREINDSVVSSALSKLDFNTLRGHDNDTAFVDHIEATSLIYRQIKSVIRDYYSDAHADTLRNGGNTIGEQTNYLTLKYKNANSPYFRSDLSAEEREFAYNAEIQMLYHPGGEHFDLRDPYAQKSIGGPTTETKVEMWANQLQHNQISDALQQLFEDNGIKMPAGKSVTFSVNPYDYRVDVSGIEDTALADSIRALLNQGQNGHALYSLLYFSNPARLGFEEPAQFSALNQEKKMLYGMVKDLTGLDVRALARQDATFLTPDGQDLWEILLEKAKDYKNDDGSAGVSLDEFKDLYQQYARTGWGSDESLSIEYRDGHLYDIGTKYGYGPGQTDWQADALLNAAEIAKRNMERIAETAQPLNVQGREDG